MKSLSSILTIALFIASAQAQTPALPPKSTPAPIPAKPPAKHSSLTYKSPKNVATATRHDVDAGTRGWIPTMPSLFVLAPNHTGLTTRGQPSLFWYQSGPANMRIELTIIEQNKPGRILRVAADKVEQGGIHRLSLERYHITLTPGVVYRWTVALIPDRANLSQNLIASDTIQRIEPAMPLSGTLAGSKGLDKAALYASHGIWYDALETVTDEIDASPKEKDLRLLRAALLDQADLKAAAASERK